MWSGWDFPRQEIPSITITRTFLNLRQGLLVVARTPEVGKIKVCRNDSRRFTCLETKVSSVILFLLVATRTPTVFRSGGGKKVTHQKQSVGALKAWAFFFPKLLQKEGHVGSRSASRNMHTSLRHSGSTNF